MTPVDHLDAIANVVAWVAVAACPLGVVGLVISWVSQHRRPAATGPLTGPGGVPPGPDPDPGPDPADQLSSPSRSTDTRPADIRSTDRR